MKAHYFISVNIEECEALINVLKNTVETAKFAKELEKMDGIDDCNPRIEVKSNDFPDENSILDYDAKIQY